MILWALCEHHEITRTCMHLHAGGWVLSFPVFSIFPWYLFPVLSIFPWYVSFQCSRSCMHLSNGLVFEACKYAMSPWYVSLQCSRSCMCLSNGLVFEACSSAMFPWHVSSQCSRYVCICPMVWFSKHVVLPWSCTQKQTQRQSSSIELWQFRTDRRKGMCAT